MKIDPKKLVHYPKYTSQYCKFYIDTNTKHLIAENFDPDEQHYVYYDYGDVSIAVDSITRGQKFQIRCEGHSRGINECIENGKPFETV